MRAFVWDSGLFPHIAVKLAETFGQVQYYCPWTLGGFPTARKRMIGVGLPGVQRVYSWLDRAPTADVVVFPDVYCHDEVEYLRSLGVPVWGAGKAEALEIERWKTRELMIELGMPVIPAEPAIGVTDLRKKLKKQEGKVWIKRSITRGDGETQKSPPNTEHIEDWIVEQEQKLGPRKEQQEFIIEQDVPGRETGYDGYDIEGDYGPVGGYGYEKKDDGYAMRVATTKELPRAIRYINDTFSRPLHTLGHRGFYSTEIRIDDEGTPYLIDPTLRAGRPPSELYIEVFDNWPEVIYYGARGEVVGLKPLAKYGVEIVLKSARVRERYLMVEFPIEAAQWIKIGNSCVIDNHWYVIPQDDDEFGAAIGIGDSLEDAYAMAEENADLVEALGVYYNTALKDELNASIASGREVGIEF